MAIYTSDANLQALYRFETTTLGDDIQNNHELTASGSPARVENSPPQGTYNASFSDGGPDFLNQAAKIALTGDYSICFWLYIDGNGTSEDIFELGTDNEDGIAIIRNWDGDKVELSQYNVWSEKKLVPGTATTATTWQHWCFTHKSGEAGNDTFVYLNGNETPDASGDFDEDMGATAAANMSIAETWEGVNLDGDLDEFAIFDRVLEPGEVSDIYNNGIQDVGVTQKSIAGVLSSGGALSRKVMAKRAMSGVL